MRFLASCAWKMADLTAQSVAPMLVRSARRPQALRDAFPRLFDDDDRPEWMRVRDRLHRIAERQDQNQRG